MVDVGGRPRTVSPEPKEMIALGEEMINWLKLHPEALHLSEWYSLEKHYLFSEWDTMSKRPEFVPYYERAMFIIGKKYLDKTSNVREGASHRWQRLYFKDLRKLEDDDSNAEAARKKEIESPKNSNYTIVVSRELATGS